MRQRDWTQGVNGLSLEEIERRSRALADRTADPATGKYRTATGYLGEGEGLAERVEADAGLVRRLGYSHEGLAAWLSEVVEAVEQLDSAQQRMPMRLVDFRGETLMVQCYRYLSPQYSLFFNEQLGASSPDNCSWATEFYIANANLPGCTLVVAGDSRVGAIDWIRRYGFYEGAAPHNPYRLDPALIVAVLTGYVTPEALEAFRARLAVADSEPFRHHPSALAFLPVDPELAVSLWLHRFQSPPPPPSPSSLYDLSSSASSSSSFSSFFKPLVICSLVVVCSTLAIVYLRSRSQSSSSISSISPTSPTTTISSSSTSSTSST